MSSAVSVASRGEWISLNFWPFGQQENAVSQEAASVKQQSYEVARRLQESQVLFGDRAQAIARLEEVAQACSVPDWDGEGALAVDLAAVQNAAAFIMALPDYLPSPECAADPDGSISLDWVPSRRMAFSISVSRGDRVAYAWLDGADKGHAVARFDGTAIPPRILSHLRQMIHR